MIFLSNVAARWVRVSDDIIFREITALKAGKVLNPDPKSMFEPIAWEATFRRKVAERPSANYSFPFPSKLKGAKYESLHPSVLLKAPH